VCPAVSEGGVCNRCATCISVGWFQSPEYGSRRKSLNVMYIKYISYYCVSPSEFRSFVIHLAELSGSNHLRHLVAKR
jgi:hypothetical protein